MQNDHVTLAGSEARTGTNTHRAENPRYRGAIITVNVTATDGDGTEDLAITIRGKDKTSGETYDLITDSFTDGATGTKVFLVYPAVADQQTAFDAIEESPLPFQFEVVGEVSEGGGSGEFTYSVGVDYLA